MYIYECIDVWFMFDILLIYHDMSWYIMVYLYIYRLTGVKISPSMMMGLRLNGFREDK